MAEAALKDAFDRKLVEGISRHIKSAWSDFDARRFEELACEGLEELELKARSIHVGQALIETMPDDFEHAASVIERALDPDDEVGISESDMDEGGIRGWAIMPVGVFVAECGVAYPDRGLEVLKQMTKRFTSEFPIRRFLIERQDEVLAVMRTWVEDENHHVRRLVSEGTRPRLPWGEQLPAFIEDPGPILPLLTALRDDPSEYVRRSVANNLNDIAKDHPDLVAEIASEWLVDASPERRKLVEHACRTLVKAGHEGALEALGYGPPALEVNSFDVLTPKVQFGADPLVFAVSFASTSEEPQSLVLDYVIHHQKANGKTTPKVFKWKKLTLAGGATHAAERKHAMKPISTRRYYAGQHRVEVVANGQTLAGEDFELQM